MCCVGRKTWKGYIDLNRFCMAFLFLYSPFVPLSLQLSQMQGPCLNGLMIIELGAWALLHLLEAEQRSEIVGELDKARVERRVLAG